MPQWGMSNPQIINTLEAKRQHLEDHVCWLEKALEQARSDLSHIAAVVRLYEAPEAGEAFPTHMNLNRLFARGELPKLCNDALEAAHGGLSTRQLALIVIESKGLDARDRHLRTSVAYRIVQVMRRQEKQRRVKRIGKRDGAIVWRLA